MLSRSFNLGKKLTLLVMIVSIVSLTITGFLSFNYADQILKEKTEDQLFGETSIRGDTIRLLFESRIKQNNILSSDPMIQFLISNMNKIPEDELKEKKEITRKDFLIQVQAFQELIGFSIEFEDVKVIGVNGKVFFSLGGIKDEDFLESQLFQRGLKESFIEFEPAGDGKKMIVVSTVFADDKKGNEAIGVIVSRMRTTSIDNILLDRSGLGNTGEVYIVNDKFLMLSESRFFENVIYQQKVNTLGVQKCFNEEQENVGLYMDYRDVSIYGSSYCAKDLGFVLLAEIDKAEVEKPIGVLQDRIFQTGIIIAIGMGIVAFIISKSFSRPLIKLKNAANKISNGDFDVRTNIKTGDEIEELSHAFDSMAQKLQESLIEIKEKEKVIKQLKGNMLLKFSQHEQNDCVGVIDMTDSTRISSKLSDQDVTKLYEIFLNFMARIILKHNGQVVKNIGDALMFRFANVDTNDSTVMENILECGLCLVESYGKLQEELKVENLPELNYKISMTYGSVKVAESTTSNISDIFGPTVNRCFKINSLCPKNSIVVGENMYKILKDFTEYEFTELCIIELKQKYDYHMFEIRRRKPIGFKTK